MRITPTHKNKKITILIIVISAIVLLGLGYTAYAYSQSKWPFTSATPTSSEPKTQEEKDELNANDPTYPTDKKEEAGETPPTTDTETDKAKIQVGISSAGKFANNVEVRAFMSGVIEGDGTCTATFTKGSQTITATSTAFIDTHTTQCNPIITEASKFSAGTWNLVVDYSSNGYEGKSASMEVTL